MRCLIKAGWGVLARGAGAAALSLICGFGANARAETMSSALSKAYRTNPSLDQQRAGVRVQDEEVPKAAAGMRPKIGITANGSAQFSRIRQPSGFDQFGNRNFYNDSFLGAPKGASFSAQQPLYDGGRTANAVRQAESGVYAARSVMRLAEQATLQTGATAYMDVLRDSAILRLNRSNVAVLEEQLRQTRQRLEADEVSATDVAQAEAALAAAKSALYAAQAGLRTSAAAYHEVIGVEPKQLAPANSIENLLPKKMDAAISAALADHPSVAAANHQADAAQHAVKVAEGALLPTLSVGVQVSQQYDSFLGTTGSRQFSAQAGATLNVPLYQGGGEYASIRQSKELSGQARLEANVQRNAARAAAVASFSQLETAKASIVSGQAAVRAAEIALSGVREEANVGQRTTYDILVAQQTLVNARLNLIAAQRNRVVASYAAAAAVGRLSAQLLRLGVAVYDPSIHFEQVRDKWIGVDAPSGG